MDINSDEPRAKSGKVRFMSITVPPKLYADLVAYSTKYDVSYAHMCRDALRYLVKLDKPPSNEGRIGRFVPQHRGSPKKRK